MIDRTTLDAEGEDGLQATAWRPWLIPFAERGGTIAVDASDPNAVLSPVVRVDWDTPDSGTIVRAESIGQMVSWWSEAVENGWWQYDRSADVWTLHWDRMPEPLRHSQLV